MNENLKKALEYMFWFAGESIPDGFDFKKNNWFMKYKWTRRQEERYIQWLSGFLKTNWKGITRYKLTSKKQIEKAVGKFLLCYGFPTRDLKIDDFSELVPDGQIKELMVKEEYDNLQKWLFGQTRSIHGIYRWDLERYLKKLPVID